MSRLGKICFAFAALTVLCFAVAKSIISVWFPFFNVLIGLFVVFMGTGFYVDRRFFKEFFAMKTTKHGMNMGVLIFGFMALIIVVNILGVRHYKTWDFSVNQVNSLSDQSIKLIKDLDSDLLFVYLYKDNVQNYEVNRKMATELIRKYQDQSARVKLEFYEADSRPDIAKKYDFKGAQAIFIDYKGKHGRVDKITEQEVTNALVRLTRTKTKNIYFTAGHGEPDIESMEDADGAGHLRQILQNNNYTVKALNLANAGKVPDDMDVLVILSPKNPFQGLEIQALEGYLRDGGNALIALDFPDKSGLNKVLNKVGITTGDGFVMNILNSALGPIVDPKGGTKASKFSTNSSITKVFTKNEGVLLRKPLELKKTKVPAGVTIEDLVTVPSSITFKDEEMKSQGALADHVVAMSASGPYPEGGSAAKPFNVVVLGDGHFLENSDVYAFLNRDLALNSVALLAKEENLISVTPKEPTGTNMELSSAKEAGLIWGFLLPMPLVFLVISIFLWIKRRHA